MVKISIKLYASGTGTADAVASFIVPLSGAIIQVNWALYATISGGGGTITFFQLSAQSTAQFALSDVRGIIDECAIVGSAATGLPAWENKVSILPGVRFNAGDKVYLHRLSVLAPATLVANVNINFA